MKKLLLASLLFTSAVTFAYTQTDVENATYLAGKNIITKQIYETKYRLDDSITRAEVVGIALKMRGEALPESYICKNYFSDVKFVPFSNDQWICRAVELAADAGLVSRGNVKFRPQDKITRAEALAILVPQASTENLAFITNEGNEWQKNILYKYLNYTETYVKFYSQSPLNDGTKIYPDYSNFANGGVAQIRWSPNKNATRAEIFAFAKNIFVSKETSIELINYANSRHNFSLQYPKNWFIDERGDISNTNIVGSDLRGTIIVSDVKNGNDLDGTGVSVKAFNIQVENVGTDRYYLSASGFSPITINNTKGVISKVISDDSTFYTVILYKNDLQFTISYTTKNQNDERIFDSILQSFTFL